MLRGASLASPIIIIILPTQIPLLFPSACIPPPPVSKIRRCTALSHSAFPYLDLGVRLSARQTELRFQGWAKRKGRGLQRLLRRMLSRLSP